MRQVYLYNLPAFLMSIAGFISLEIDTIMHRILGTNYRTGLLCSQTGRHVPSTFLWLSAWAQSWFGAHMTRNSLVPTGLLSNSWHCRDIYSSVGGGVCSLRDGLFSAGIPCCFQTITCANPLRHSTPPQYAAAI
jgi:hypothetical protein